MIDQTIRTIVPITIFAQSLVSTAIALSMLVTVALYLDFDFNFAFDFVFGSTFDFAFDFVFCFAAGSKCAPGTISIRSISAHAA